MKIAMIFPTLASEKAISTYSIHLLESLKKKRMNIEGVTYTAGSPSTLLKKLGKLYDYDVVHIQHEYNLLGWYGAPFFLVLFLLWIFKKGRLVITMHTAPSKKQKFKGNTLKNLMRKILYLSQNRLLNWASDAIIVNEKFYRDVLVSEYGFSKNKIHHIPQGVPKNIPLINKKKAKKELNISGPVYLMIGNLTYDNGSDIVLKQAGKIKKNILFVTNPNAVNTRNKKKMFDWINFNKMIVKKNNFENFVRFDLKEIPTPLWWKYFSAADLLLQPYREGVRSGVFSDAMASKTPVIASNIKFFNEMSKNFGCLMIAGKEGEYSKLIKQAMKPRNYLKMKKECERYAKLNSLSNLANDYKKIYNSVRK